MNINKIRLITVLVMVGCFMFVTLFGATVVSAAQDGATFVSETYPDNTSVPVGQSFTKSWTLKNSGTSTWNSGYKIGYVNGSLSTSQANVPVSGSVGPGQNYTFSVPMKAPSTAGTYTENWKLVNGSGTMILVSGASTFWAKIVSVVSTQDGATFVSETYPDNTSVPAGQSFTKTWTLKNSGTSTWNSGYKIGYVNGSLSTSQADVPVSGSVGPGQNHTFSVPMKAPSTAGTYTENWKLVNGSGTTILVSGASTFWAKIVSVVSAQDGATFVSETYPDNTSVPAGQSFTKTWTLKNSGTSTWNSGYKIGYVNGSLSTSQADVPVSGSVGPGQNYTFSVPMKAPSTAGTYTENWKLVNGSGTTILVSGASTFWAKIVSVVSAQDGATFVSETYPDNTSVPAGQSFTKTWTLKNSGTSTWNSGYKIGYVNGSLSTSQADVPVSGSVGPGQNYTFSVPMKAPSTAGTYTENWKLVNGSGTTILISGASTFWAKIKVSGSSGTVIYDRQSAVNYAQYFWNRITSDGCFWDQTFPVTSGLTSGDFLGTRETSGYDCAHFVSNCIGNEPHFKGGGLDVALGSAPAYGLPSAGALGDWVISSKNGVEVNSVDLLEPGDIINYDWDNNGSWDHVALYLGNLKVASHSNSFWNADWQLGYLQSRHRFIHIFATSDSNTSYTLIYTAGANGSISGTSTQTVDSGGSGIAVTAVPNAGYHFVNWSDSSTANPRTDANVMNNISVTANFANNTYTLNYTAGANGSISGTSTQTVASGGSGTAVTAVPNAGYHFVNWSDSSTDNPRTDMGVTTNISVTANFANNTYTLNYTAGANGCISGTSTQTVASGGSGVAVTAVPYAGYHFVNWSDSSTDNPRTDTGVVTNISVTANFANNTYTLNYTAGANGSISGTSTQTVASGGSGVAVTAVPYAGYHFVNWSDSSTDNPRTDTGVVTNISVTANFANNTYTLNYTAGANGSISGTSDQTVASGGSGIAVTAVPNAGYHFVNWSDSSTANPRTDTNVMNNISVTANFANNTYTLNYTAGANGSISGTSTQTVASGGSGTAVTAVPNAGYLFVNWSDSSTDNPRTDTGVTTNISVTANFAINPLSGVNLLLSPNTQTTTLGGTLTVIVQAQCGSLIVDGIDTFLDYDPAYLAVQSATPGTSLTTVLSPVIWNNTTGTFGFSAGQIAAPFPSGNFTVVTITFQAKSVTSSPTQISFHNSVPWVTNADSSGSNVTGKLTSATVQIIQVNVNLNVVLQGGSRPDTGWVVPLTVKFFTPGTISPTDVLTATPVYTITQSTTKSGGTAMIQITGITPGTYDITANSTTMLCNVKRNIVIGVSPTDLNMGTLLEGNANGDQIINIQDFGVLAAAYGKYTGQPGFDARADFDRNGNINISDFGLLAANYGKTGPVTVP